MIDLTFVVLRQTNWKPATAEEFARIDFEVQTPSRNYAVFIAGDGLQQQQGLEAGVPLAILAAMRTGNDLRVEGALSETFLQGVKQYIEIFTRAFPDFKPIKIVSASTYNAEVSDPPSKRCASFFSGGVDSFYTLFKGAGEITDIIYIHGFDVRLDDIARRAAIDKMASNVATELGITYRAVESNMGKVLQDFGSWPAHSHGLALIAVARLMAGTLKEVRIPSSFSIAEQKPWGSWLLTDPLFSDERMQIMHDACEARRMDKVKSLAREPLFLRHVRVCWERVDGMSNCCQCEKCMRTMTSLSIIGVLQQATAFSLPLDAARIAAVCLPRPGLRIFPQENLAFLQDSGKKMPELENALKKQLSRPIWVSRLRIKWRKRVRRLRNIIQRLTEAKRY